MAQACPARAYKQYPSIRATRANETPPISANDNVLEEHISAGMTRSAKHRVGPGRSAVSAGYRRYIFWVAWESARPHPYWVGFLVALEASFVVIPPNTHLAWPLLVHDRGIGAHSPSFLKSGCRWGRRRNALR